MKNRYSVSQNKYLKEIGRNIFKLRQKKKLSQEALALKANLDRTYIGSVERGERNVSALNLKKIAYALQVHTAALFSSRDSDKSD